MISGRGTRVRREGGGKSHGGHCPESSPPRQSSNMSEYTSTRRSAGRSLWVGSDDDASGFVLPTASRSKWDHRRKREDAIPRPSGTCVITCSFMGSHHGYAAGGRRYAHREVGLAAIKKCGPSRASGRGAAASNNPGIDAVASAGVRHRAFAKTSWRVSATETGAGTAHESRRVLPSRRQKQSSSTRWGESEGQGKSAETRRPELSKSRARREFDEERQEEPRKNTPRTMRAREHENEGRSQPAPRTQRPSRAYRRGDTIAARFTAPHKTAGAVEDAQMTTPRGSSRIAVPQEQRARSRSGDKRRADRIATTRAGTTTPRVVFGIRGDRYEGGAELRDHCIRFVNRVEPLRTVQRA